LRANFKSELILGDGNVHIFNKEENVWPLRHFVAENLAWLIAGKPLVERLTYSKDSSNYSQEQ